MEKVNVKKLRFAYGLTQEQLALILDVSQGMVSKLERGERELTLDQRVKLRELGGKKVVLRKKT